jgi:DedD protein
VNNGLKQRLVGALVLLGVAVIFLPGFFKQHTQYQVDTRSQIPPRPETVPVVIDTPQASITTEPAPAPETMFLPEQASSNPLSASSVRASSSSSVAASSSRVGGITRAASHSSAPLMADAWVVQVASYTDPADAQQLRKRLQARGYKAYVRLAQLAQGQVSRVFIGPKLDKALALEVKNEVDPLFKVDSMVLLFKP